MPLCMALCLLVFFQVMQAPTRWERAAETALDGDAVVGALRLALPQDVHAYAHDPGDAGRPTTLRFNVAGGPPQAVWYPQGAVQRDFYDPSATIFVPGLR